MDTRIGVTGANGYIGKALVAAGAFPLSFDVTKPEEIKSGIEEVKPDVILHLASKSNPDWCEKWENRFILSAVNVRGTYNVMYAASQLDIPCVLMSTGQIWNGGFWEREHSEYSKPTPPVNQYGLSKLSAETVAKMFQDEGGRIIRSSFVIDSKRLASKLGKLRAREELHEPTFIRRSFIYLDDIVHLLFEYCIRIREMPPVLHLAGSETVSWHEFMWDVACKYRYDTELVKPRKTKMEGVAPRPGNAGLDTSLASRFGFRIPHHTDGIMRMRNES
jgi:dTDP-4-dehydrorhamnose reductase